MNLPQQLVKNLISIYGPQGKKWLNDLPCFLSSYENKWKFKLKDFFNNANFNVVASITLDNGHQAILKCCIPNKEFTTEVLALRHFEGIGAVRLLRSEPESGIMLLEKLIPGTLLENSPNEIESTQIAVELINKLHKPPPKEGMILFPSLADWFQGFNRLYQYFQGKTGPFPKK